MYHPRIGQIKAMRKRLERSTLERRRVKSNKKKRKGTDGKKLKTNTEKIFHEKVSATYTTASNNILSQLFIQQVVKWLTFMADKYFGTN